MDSTFVNLVETAETSQDAVFPAPPSPTPSAPTPPAPTRGRNRKAVWDLMDVDDKDVWCKRCGKLVHSSGRTHVERVEKHVYSRCQKRPSSYKITDLFQPKMNASVLKEFQERFAWWVYTTGMPFYKTEHHALVEALQVLNPGISVPSAYQLANPLLDAAYNKSIGVLTVKLGGRVVTLETDGWTDINGMAVVNYMAVSGDLSYFLESVYTGAQSHDTLFLVADVKRVLLKYKRIKFGSVITDNTPANKAMWEDLQSEFPKMFFHGCVCHALHLLVKDMRDGLPWLLTLEAGCKELVAFFKRSHKLWFVLRRKLKEKKLRALVLPGDTRWGSLLACLDSVLAAESILFTMVSARGFQSAKTKSQRQKRKSVFNLVTSRDFVSQLKRGTKLLRVVAKHLVKFEKDSTPISEVYKTFLDMPSEFAACNLTPRELKSVEGIITKRFDFVYGDAHGLAYLLDPRFCGDGMDVTTRGSVEKFMSGWFGENKADDVLIQLASYHRYVTELKDSTSRQWKLLDEARLPVFDFWCGLKEFDLLQEIAKQLFRCAGSTSAAERNFSTHAFIHSKLRNRLTPDRVEKLVHIFFNAKNVDEDDLEEYTHIEDVMVNIGDNEAEDEQNQDDAYVYY